MIVSEEHGTDYISILLDKLYESFIIKRMKPWISIDLESWGNVTTDKDLYKKKININIGIILEIEKIDSFVMKKSIYFLICNDISFEQYNENIREDKGREIV